MADAYQSVCVNQDYSFPRGYKKRKLLKEAMKRLDLIIDLKKYPKYIKAIENYYAESIQIWKFISYDYYKNDDPIEYNLKISMNERDYYYLLDLFKKIPEKIQSEVVVAFGSVRMDYTYIYYH